MVPRWCCVFLLVLFVLPAAAAERGDVAAGLTRWTAASQQVHDDAFFGDESSIELYRLGDADGDGRGDLLVGASTYSGSKYTAYSGADLTTQLWSAAADDDSYEFPGGDIDGDGVTDLVAFAYGPASGTGQWQGTPVGGAGVGTYGGEDRLHLFSGTKHNVIAEHALPWNYASGYAYLNHPGAYTGGGPGASTYTNLLPMGRDALLRIESTGLDADVFHSNQAAYAFASTYQDDAIISFVDAAGAVRGKVNFIDPTATIMAGAPADLNGDGVTDVTLVNVHSIDAYAFTVGEFVEVPLLIPEILAYNGADGSKLWGELRPSTYGYPVFVTPVGDVDGDGGQDIGYIEWKQNPTGTAYTYDLLILSGKTGATIGSMLGERTPWLPVAFGDVTGDGAAEMMLVDIESETEIQVVNADLTPVWSASIAGYPLNIEIDPYTGYFATGATDWTGDGKPDLVMETFAFLDFDSMEDGSFSSSVVEVRNGTDGSIVWSTAGAEAQWYWAISELSGTGAGDLLVVTGDGMQNNGTVTFDVLRGEDGSLLWHQVLRDPVLAPLKLPDASVWVRAKSVGDLDGDGREEVAVMVEESTSGFFGVMAEMVPSTPSRSSQPPPVTIEISPGGTYETFQTWYVFSSSAGLTLASLETHRTGMGVSGGIGAMRAVSDAAGEESPLPAGDFYADTDDAGPRDQDSPSPALGFLLLGLAAMVVATRRRNL